MGKKKTRGKYTSKGIHSKTSSGIHQAIRAERTWLDKLEFIEKAWKAGLNPWITVENPTKSETNRKFIRVKTNEWWGSPKFSRE